MAKTRTDKDRVLDVLVEAGAELTTAKIATRAGCLHPSTRRILNELRVDGVVRRGAVHGTWITDMIEEEDTPVATELPVVEGEILDTPIIEPGQGEPVPSIVDVNARRTYRLDCEGDTVYVEETDESSAFERLQSAISDTENPLPRNLVTITEVQEIPIGANVLVDGVMMEAVGDDDPQSDDEPKGEL